MVSIREASRIQNIERGDTLGKLKELESLELEDLMQKAKLKWVVDGDESSISFNGIMSSRRRQNCMHGILFDRVWETELHKIKGSVF